MGTYINVKPEGGGGHMSASFCGSPGPNRHMDRRGHKASRTLIFISPQCCDVLSQGGFAGIVCINNSEGDHAILQNGASAGARAPCVPKEYPLVGYPPKYPLRIGDQDGDRKGTMENTRKTREELQDAFP